MMRDTHNPPKTPGEAETHSTASSPSILTCAFPPMDTWVDAVLEWTKMSEKQVPPEAKTTYKIYSEERERYDTNTRQGYVELVTSGEKKWVPLEVYEGKGAEYAKLLLIQQERIQRLEAELEKRTEQRNTESRYAEEVKRELEATKKDLDIKTQNEKQLAKALSTMTIGYKEIKGRLEATAKILNEFPKAKSMDVFEKTFRNKSDSEIEGWLEKMRSTLKGESNRGE